MRIALVGGIFHRSHAGEDVQPTTEMLLARGLRKQGEEVRELSPRDVFSGMHGAFGGADVIHVHHPGRLTTLLSISGSSTPIVYTPHRMFSPDKWVLAVGHHRLLRRATAVIALSPQEIEQHRQAGIPPQRVRFIPNGMSTHEFAPATRILPSPRAPLRLLYVGQLARVKRVDLILRAVAMYAQSANVELRLVFHRDQELGLLQQLTCDLGLEQRVTWVGSRSGSSLADEFQRAHALVLASRSEALPSVVTEALLTGLPVIAPRVGGIPWQVGEWGVLVDEVSPTSLCDSFAALFESSLFDSVGAAQVAELTRSRFDLGAMIQAHRELYQEIVDGRTHARR